jgi:hypothetical protein
MQGKSLIDRWRLTAFGVVLCLLAAVFSFEAKIAWYSPSPEHREISAAKLQPTEAHKLVTQALSPANRMPASQLAWLTVFALLAVAMLPLRRAESEDAQDFSSPGAFSFRFSRPPPTR